MSAVSTSVPPASTKAVSCIAASSSSVSRPHVMVPSASRDTTRPLRPSARCSTRGQLTGALRRRRGRDTGWGRVPLPTGLLPDRLPRMPTPDERLQELLHSGDQAAWTTAALVTVLRGSGSEAQQTAAGELLRALGLDVGEAMAGRDVGGVAAEAAAPVLQVAALLRGEADLWAGQSDEALLAQGWTTARPPRWCGTRASTTSAICRRRRVRRP